MSPGFRLIIIWTLFRDNNWDYFRLNPVNQIGTDLLQTIVYLQLVEDLGVLPID